MSILQWKTEYQCGVASIDHEHEEMFGVINDLYAKLADNCDADTLALYLGEIHGLIEAHFALEEKLMRDRGYGNYQAHKADHDQLLDDLRDIMDDTHGNVDFSRDALGVRLQSWFADHFSTMDRDLPELAR